MNTIKRLLGILWMLLAPAVVIFLLMQANTQIGKAATALIKTNLTLQWAIILIIFVPICIGMVIFGYYALHGDYDHLPESSADLE
jgi:hypothetical protein